MDSYQKILAFPEQFAWKPNIEHSGKKNNSLSGRVAICGMGGSALAGSILKTWLKNNEIIIHRDFHIPSPAPKHIIAISYSGNTEETLSAVEDALKKSIPLFLIASGGKLESIAHDRALPFIKLPQGYQPREALGFMVRALTSILAPRHEKEIEALAHINGEQSQSRGKKIGNALCGKIPLIYSSERMSALAYNWKIKINETGKTPAFTAVIPELFHNEMTGFNMGKKTKKLADIFAFILLEDPDDSPEIKKRIATFKKFAASKGFTVFHEKLLTTGFVERFIGSVHLADWTSYFLAKCSGADPENVPWVEEFKALTRKD